MKSIFDESSYILVALSDYDWEERETNEALIDSIETWARDSGTAVAIYTNTNAHSDIYEITLVFTTAYDQTIWALTHADQLGSAAITVITQDL